VTGLEIVLALVIALGVVGVLVPFLPGSALVGGAVLLWAAVTGGATAWLLAAVALAVLVAGAVTKYAVPGRRLQAAGVPTRTLFLGGVVGVVGFFVVPVVGLVLGFLAGVFLAEWHRLGDPGRARTATGQAVRAVGVGMLIELGAALVAAAVWAVGVALA
jgi:uncharacterized protein YqgC (DUF456 family)